MTARTVVLCAGLLALTGCGGSRLDFSKTYELGRVDSAPPIELPPQPNPQRVTVEYESNAPVEVAIFNTADVKDGSYLPSKARAIEKTKSNGSLSVDLGPGEATTVMVSSLSQPATVKVHIHNRK